MYMLWECNVLYRTRFQVISCIFLILQQCHLVQASSHSFQVKQVWDYVSPAHLHLSNEHHQVGLMFFKPIGHSTTNVFWFNPNIASSLDMHAWMKGSIGIGYRSLLRSHQTIGIYFYYDYGAGNVTNKNDAARIAPHTMQLGLEGRADALTGTISGYTNYYSNDRALLQVKDSWGGHIQLGYYFWSRYAILGSLYTRSIRARESRYMQEYNSHTIYSYYHDVTRSGRGCQHGATFTLKYTWTDSQASSISYTIDKYNQSKWIVTYRINPKKTRHFKHDLQYTVDRYGGTAIFLDEENAIGERFRTLNTMFSRQKHQDFLDTVKCAKEAIKGMGRFDHMQKKAISPWVQLPHDVKEKPSSIEADIAIEQAVKLWLRLPLDLREQLIATSQITDPALVVKAQKEIIEALNKNTQHIINPMHSMNFLPFYDQNHIAALKDSISILNTFFKSCSDPFTVISFLEDYPYFCEIYTGGTCTQCRTYHALTLQQSSSEGDVATGNAYSTSLFMKD